MIGGLLRTELGFSGVVVSDDLEMAGVAWNRPLESSAFAALRAGSDLLIVSRMLLAERCIPGLLADLAPRDHGMRPLRRRRSSPLSSAFAASSRVSAGTPILPRPAPYCVPPTTWPCSRRSNAVPAAEALVWARRAFPGLDPASARPLPPAGSSRTLTRLFHTGGSLVLVENPVEVTAAVNENDAFGYLAAHLGARGIPVPGVLAYKRSRGWALVEDLGDRDLFAEVRRALHGRMPAAGHSESRERVAALYREALDVLVRFQIDGVEGFDPRRTHNPPRYDIALMREGESGYFVRELLGRHLGLAAPAGLDAELDRLAERAAAAGTAYLLHRDYQSQNLKIHLGRICVIDFQGARLGPAQYDLAALLLDPYADLPADLRRELLEHYLELFTARTHEDRGRFLELYPLVAAHRLMQALGAYAFLGLQRGKPGVSRARPRRAAPARGDPRPDRGHRAAARRRGCRCAAASGGDRGHGRSTGRGGPGPGRMSPAPHPPRAMVLAAGLGTRLRPLTDAIPKPLVPIANRPLLEYTFALLAGAGVREAIVNAHHLPEHPRRGAAQPRRLGAGAAHLPGAVDPRHRGGTEESRKFPRRRDVPAAQRGLPR